MRARSWKKVAEGVKGISYCWGFRCFNEEVAAQLIKEKSDEVYVICPRCVKSVIALLAEQVNKVGAPLYGFRLEILKGGK